MDKCGLSVVVPVYNCSETVEACLSSLLHQTVCDKMSVEFIVVDDGSTDGTREIVKKFPVNLIEIKHSGRSVARNVGYRKSRGDLVFFAEADGYFDTKFLEILVEHLMKNPKSGTTGGYGEPWPSEGMLYRWRKEQNTLWNIDYEPKGGSIFRRSDLERIGLYDPSLPRGEDVELCNRLRKLGYIFVRDPRAKWWHKEPQTLRELLKHAFEVGGGIVPFREREGTVVKTLITSVTFIFLFAFSVGMLFVSLIGLLPLYVMIVILTLFFSSYSIPVFHVKNKKQKLRMYKAYVTLYPLVKTPSRLSFSVGFLKQYIIIKHDRRNRTVLRAWLFRKWSKMVIIHFLAFTTNPGLYSESMPSKLTQPLNHELKPFFTN